LTASILTMTGFDSRDRVRASASACSTAAFVAQLGYASFVPWRGACRSSAILRHSALAASHCPSVAMSHCRAATVRAGLGFRRYRRAERWLERSAALTLDR